MWVPLGLIFVTACGSGDRSDDPSNPERSDDPQVPTEAVDPATESPTTPPTADETEEPSGQPQASPTPEPAPSGETDPVAELEQCQALMTEGAQSALPHCRNALALEVGHERRFEAFVAFADVLAATEHPEQARFYYRSALRLREDAAVRERFVAVERPQPNRRTLRRPILPRVAFERDGSGSTWRRTTAAESVERLQVWDAPPSYRETASDQANGLSLGIVTVQPEERSTYQVLVLRRAAGWNRLETAHSTDLLVSYRQRIAYDLIEARFQDVIAGGPPEVIATFREETQDEHECQFMQRDERILIVFGVDDEAVYRLATITLERTEAHEAAVRCETPPERVGPTFHWELRAEFFPDAGEFEIQAVSGTFDEEVLGGRRSLRDHHCSWARNEVNWPCPH